jgi:hypothetical protein
LILDQRLWPERWGGDVVRKRCDVMVILVCESVDRVSERSTAIPRLGAIIVWCENMEL